MPRSRSGPIGVGARLEDEHADAVALLVAVGGRGACGLAHERAERRQAVEADPGPRARRRRRSAVVRLAPSDSGSQPGVQHRATRRDRPVGEAVDGQAADDQHRGHRSIIDRMRLFFYELHEGATDLMTDALLVSERDHTPEQFASMVNGSPRRGASTRSRRTPWSRRSRASSSAATASPTSATRSCAPR